MSKKRFTESVQVSPGRMGALIPPKKDATYIAKDDEGIKQQAREMAEEIRISAAKLKGEGKLARRGRPPRLDKVNKFASAAEKGTMPGETRKTYLVNIGLAEKIEAIAKYKYTTVKETMREAMAEYIARYEKKNGEVRPIPKSD
jgi:hypothetical protein